MNLASLLERQLSASRYSFLRSLGEIATRERIGLFLAGGAVRDALLGQGNLDLDIVVEGDAFAFAQTLKAHRGGGNILRHERFGTAKYTHGELAVDLATARSEIYVKPGALPVVKPAPLKEDLARRDFTINAMALDLGVSRFGELLDPFHGLEDMEKGRIRSLHARSFVDDATRILRAVRYEQRLDFRLEEETAASLIRYRTMLDTISGDRIRHEMERWFGEKNPGKVFDRAQELGVLQAIHPALVWRSELQSGFTEAARLGGPPVEARVFLAILAFLLSPQDRQGLVKRLSMPGNWAAVLSSLDSLEQRLPELASQDIPNNRLFHLLEGLDPYALQGAALMAKDLVHRRRMEHYLNTLRGVRPELKGRDIIALGAQPGPELGALVARLLDAKLDGLAPSRADEEALIRQWLRS